jgi:hypothetical protein
MTINQEASTIGMAFGVTPDLYALNDSSSANAYADCDGHRVMFGLRLLSEELGNPANGPLAVAGIMAHEFGHIFQCDKSSPLREKNRELQADFLAGWYLHNAKAAYGLDISGFARSVWSKGDYQFTSPLHHGTPDERVRAMAAGFRTDTTDADEAYDASLKYFHVPREGEREDPVPLPKPRMCRQQVPCVHPTQITRVVECTHPVPCQHVFMTPYGPRTAHQADPMHPYGDPVILTVPQHEFDVVEGPCE